MIRFCEVFRRPNGSVQTTLTEGGDGRPITDLVEEARAGVVDLGCGTYAGLVGVAGGIDQALLARLYPLDIMARLWYGRRRRGNVEPAVRASSVECLAEDFLVTEDSDRFRRWIALGRRSYPHVPASALVTLLMSADNPGRQEYAKAYLSTLAELVTLFCGWLVEADQMRVLRAELLLGLVALKLTLNPANALPLCPITLRRLRKAWREGGDKWCTSARAIAYRMGLPFPGVAPQSINGNWTQLGTWTGRLTCSDPPLQSASPVPGTDVDLREAVVAPEGHLLVSLDYRAAELTGLRAFTSEWQLDDYDPAAVLAGHDKQATYATMYGWGGGRVEDLPEPICTRVRWLYKSLASRAESEDGAILTLGGRCLNLGPCEACGTWPRSVTVCRRCGRPRERASPGSLLSNLLQASVADAMRYAVPRVDFHAEACGGRTLLVRHDEVLCSVPASALTDFLAKAVPAMSDPIPDTHLDGRVRVKVGERWSALEEQAAI